jgi:hypothetical protein
MRAAPNNVVASTREFHNVRKDTAGAMPAARKLWFMPRGELSELRAKSPIEQRHSAQIFVYHARVLWRRMGLFMSSDWD